MKKIIYKLPILDFNTNFCLGDYIDNIKTKDLKYPIMVGVDLWKRPYITIKFNETKYQKYRAITVFQRYTNDKKNWTFGGICGPPPKAIELKDISRVYSLPNKLYKYILDNSVFETDAYLT